MVVGIGRGSFADYNVQSFLRLGDDLFLQEYEVDGEGDAYLEAVALLMEVARSLRVRPSNEIPNEPGLCLDGAFLREPARYMLEEVTLGIRLPQFEDVHMAIEMTKKEILIESDALEPRMNHAKQAAFASGMGKWYSRIKFLRSGYRHLGAGKGSKYLPVNPRKNLKAKAMNSPSKATVSPRTLCCQCFRLNCIPASRETPLEVPNPPLVTKKQSSCGTRSLARSGRGQLVGSANRRSVYDFRKRSMMPVEPKAARRRRSLTPSQASPVGGASTRISSTCCWSIARNAAYTP